MRQVNRDELQWKIVTALRTVPRSVWRDMIDPRQQVSDRALAMVAGRAATALDSLEVLSSAPAASDATFRTPIARMLGEDVGSGAPVISGGAD
jgi:hypothetical protein